MSVLLYLLGVLCVLGGGAAIGFGVPVKEFSFGNTLILAGTTALVAGFVVIGLAAAISQLQRIGEMLGARPLSKAGRLEPFEAPAKIPFPPKPKASRRETPAFEPAAAPPIGEETREPEFPAPSLRNPDVPLMAEEEAQELPLSPRYSEALRERTDDFRAEKDTPSPESDQQTSFEPPRRSPRREAGYFDQMWPAGERNPAPPSEEGAQWSDSVPGSSLPSEPDAGTEPPLDDAAPVGILKSGAIDGMGYTLYVDGSIEAELPEGVLHFASINELRQHLQENSRT